MAKTSAVFFPIRGRPSFLFRITLLDDMRKVYYKIKAATQGRARPNRTTEWIQPPAEQEVAALVHLADHRGNGQMATLFWSE
jgi:hypothetical protein